MEFDFNQIRDLLALLSQTDIAELTLKSGTFEMTVRKEGRSLVSNGADGVSRTEANSVVPLVPPPSGILAMPEIPAPAPPSAERLVDVTSPMVGTFYRAPSPDDAPFVNVGDRIRSGQAVCIIEAMKLMNELEAEVTGEVVDILAENGQPVEYGQVLMRVKPG